METNISLTSVILFVRDVEGLKDFYTRLFQFEPLEYQPDMWALLKAGDFTIGLHRMGDEYLAATTNSPKTNNNVKLVFDISENIHQLRSYLLDQRVAIGDIKTFDDYNYWLCDGQDPEGNVFQLRQSKTN
ncbi:VOC family protein [Mucilaginibacter sp. L3T2-6]|uniref:VOC family protein n=1 Tax=Mucilaginibacter sp. L3T2-6 TaxID=3062491 RepID=UPI0026761F08|nr:hypothetical protein [Mucilaginibacter sp. L3T2-6]MDO3644994.1 hypothetical protein [Mucilaginibacter sp. L3T2-6]MDV6217445.1 hypothetical protein [Mucilaginibacter sp. L3T2-6]